MLKAKGTQNLFHGLLLSRGRLENKKLGCLIRPPGVVVFCGKLVCGSWDGPETCSLKSWHLTALEESCSPGVKYSCFRPGRQAALLSVQMPPFSHKVITRSSQEQRSLSPVGSMFLTDGLTAQGDHCSFTWP